MEEKSIEMNPETVEEVKPKKPRTKKSAEVKAEMPEEAETAKSNEAPALSEAAEGEEAYLGKFKSVDALMRAYRELEAEFTRRSQRLKALEESAPPCGNADEQRAPVDEELYKEVTQNEGVRTRVIGDYLSSLGKGVPLMTGGGAGVKTPADKPKSIREAGSLALGYLRNQKN